MKAKRIGDVQEVLNKNPHWAALKKYSFIRLQYPDGEEVPHLFTDRELASARKRAQNNPEDLPKVCWIRDIVD